MTEPMTAAEYRAMVGKTWSETRDGRAILAALEERERLLGEREANSADAALGALVRRIREHPKSVAPVVHDGYGLDVFTVPVSEDGFRALLSHLDSLLPKEPEVVVGESGREYRRPSGFVASVEVRHRNADGVATAWEIVSRVPVMDAPVVAALLAKGGKDG